MINKSEEGGAEMARSCKMAWWLGLAGSKDVNVGWGSQFHSMWTSLRHFLGFLVAW